MSLSDASLRVPGGSVSDPRAVQIPFDRPDPKIPYEERRIEDRELFATFGRRVVEHMAPLVADPLIGSIGRWFGLGLRIPTTWCVPGPGTASVGGSCVGVGDAGGSAKQRVHGEAFQWFARHLLARLPEFRAIHNEAVREYRRTHHVRSLSHPVPELAEEGSWLEAPLWVWTAGEPHRRRLFARRDRRRNSDFRSAIVGSPVCRLQADGHAGRAVERLLELQRGGVRIRSRALVTTLWARLALGDLFIHGIGGAKYDRVTDLLIERFFGLRPPVLMVVSATLLLPIQRDRVTDEDLRAIRRQLRDLTYHPERYPRRARSTAVRSDGRQAAVD